MIQLYTEKSKRIYKLRELTKEFSKVLNRRINLQVVFPQYCISISQQMKIKQFKDYNTWKKYKENKINLTEVYGTHLWRLQIFIKMCKDRNNANRFIQQKMHHLKEETVHTLNIIFNQNSNRFILFWNFYFEICVTLNFV